MTVAKQLSVAKRYFSLRSSLSRVRGNAPRSFSESLQVLVFERVDGVVAAKLAAGIEHRGKNHGEHTADRNGNRRPRDHERLLDRLPDHKPR